MIHIHCDLCGREIPDRQEPNLDEDVYVYVGKFEEHYQDVCEKCIEYITRCVRGAILNRKDEK